MNEFVTDRHNAFADVLHNDDLSALRKYCKKYGVPFPEHKKIAKAGVYKAIQYCNDFTEDEKTLAMEKCLDLGFTPFIKPYEEDDK